ncbi:mechanosensitive ion channel [Myxosarcina sp. GI1]|uniref:mechanosensitive ion channel n=1 Tax=Myxosarcina sp. GI1 TaxID=1541065 RepID=UPI000567B9F5|nr:mechanosensitive ion channel [Myxosarcina sp. GI1]
MTQILSAISSAGLYHLAQNNSNQIFSNVGNEFGTSLLNLVKAIGIFILILIVAFIVKSVIKGLLSKTDIDNRIAAWLTGQRGGESIPVENWIANLVFWLIVLFAVVAFLNTLELDGVSQPLNSLLDRIASFIPKILGAAFLLGIAWLVATIVKTIVTRGLRALDLDRRLGLESTGSNFNLSDTIGNALYWFIFLLFLPAILNTLSLQGTLEPVQSLLDEILAILPNVLGAIIIGVVFWFVAQIVRRIVTNLLAATGIDNIGARFGMSTTASGRQSLSSIIGTLVFVLILIPGAIAVLEQLQIEAISAPAINMLDQVLELLPKLFAAAVVLGLFYVAGKFVADLVTNILTSVGFNNLLQWLGLTSTPSGRPTGGEAFVAETEQPTVIQSGTPTTKTPSELVGIIVLVGIMLIATLTAVDILGIPALASVVGVILAIAGQILIGLIVFAIGLYLANLAYNLILSSGTGQSRLLAQTSRVVIIVFVASIALIEIGLAPNLVNLAFGLLLGGIAVAIALAFGLGGREVAGEQLRHWVNSYKNRS